MANNWRTRQMTDEERREDLRREAYRTLTRNVNTLQGQYARRENETNTATQNRVNNAVGRNDVLTRDRNTAQAMLAYARDNQPPESKNGNSPI